jgi:pyridoxamine 5'-phosphate oxidase
VTEADPFARFRSEFDQAAVSEEFEASRCALATADASGAPTVRFVLLKGVDPRGFVFFTNFESVKARALDQNPRAEMAFHWHTTGVQVRVRGVVERVSDEDADAYFATRDRGSQLGAWASKQSTVLDARESLEREVEEVARRFENVSVTRPPYWGGFRIVPSAIEFWYNRDDRLHDRWLYARDRDEDAWALTRLYP